MNGPTSGGPEEQVWERPWSLEEIRRSSQNWSLGADAGLLNFLREFSQQIVSRTHDIEKQLDGLVRETKATDCRLHNIFNDFLMLSNTQFIENRVYDEEIEEPVTKPDTGDKPEQEKSREQKEAELIPKIQQAVNYGLQVLETAFEQLDIKAGNSDSEEEEVNGRVEPILEPKDLYLDRPLPHLIGSQLFMQQDDVGLGDISSEEGSVDNDHGSIIDSEEDEKEDEESDDYLENSDDGKKMHLALSDEDEDNDNSSDLFGDSEKEEDDEKSVKPRTKSFADELAERIQGDVVKKPTLDQSSISSIEVKSKKEKEKSKVKKPPSDDEDDDIFKPPKLTEEDFSPFSTKGHLFSGGHVLFDDDEEGDLFADAPKKEVYQAEVIPELKSESLPSNARKKPPVGGVSLFPGGEDVIGSSILAEKKPRHSSHAADTAPKMPSSKGLFDDEDGLFGSNVVEPTAKPPVKAKPPSDLFADDDDLFKEHSFRPSNAKETETKQNPTDKKLQEAAEKPKPPEPATKKPARGLFSDEDDSETDLFSPSQSVGKPKTPIPAAKTSKPLSFFDDEDEEDLFRFVQEKKPLPVKPPKPATLPAEHKTLGLFSSDEEEPIASLSQKKKDEENHMTNPAPIAKEKGDKKDSLFEDDLFAITKDSQKKSHRVSLLFEEDNNTNGSLFAPKVVSANPGDRDSEPPKMSVPSKPDKEKESLFSNVEISPNTNVSVEKEAVTRGDVKAKQLEDGKNGDLFPASPPAGKHTKPKSKTVLSLFEDEEEDPFEDQLPINVKEKISEKVSSDKGSHVKSTGVFQDEELLFSQEVQRDNDPDVDLFASTKKQSSEKPNQTKLSVGTGLFGDEDDDDLFSSSSSKSKKPPKVQEKKTVIKKETLDISKGVNDVPEVKKEAPLKKNDVEANLHINPAAMLPGAVPKLSTLRLPNQEHQSTAADVTDSRSPIQADDSMRGGVSFESPVQVDTLHSANKTRAKVGGKRRPPTRLGRKLASKESSETDDQGLFSPVSPTHDRKHQDESLKASHVTERDPPVSSIKVSLSENDIQSNSKTTIVTKPLTPDVDDLFGSDLFANTAVSSPPASKINDPSPNAEFTSKPLQTTGKKSTASALREDGSDDDLFQKVKQKKTKAVIPSSLVENEPGDDLFGNSKTDVKTVTPKEAKAATKDIFKDDLDDIFATESTKPVKKAKEKKQTQEPNLFDDHLDIFADFTQKSKDKKSKKKVEPKSIFDDDMDDIFSSSNVKKSKPKVKPSHPAAEPKPDSKPSSAFEDPLNVLGN